MALEFLKKILGDAYTEDIDKQVSAEIGKSFVAKTDFDAKNTELKTANQQLADAAATLEGFKAKDIDVETIRQQVDEYKGKAEQAAKDAAAQLEAYKFDTWFDGLVTQYKGRDKDVIRTLAGDDRIKGLRTSQNRDAEGKALFDQLQKDKAYAFEDPAAPPYASGTGTTSFGVSDAAMRSAMGLSTEEKK